LKYAVVAIILLLLTTFAAIAAPATAQPRAADQNLYLRRVIFDPLQSSQTSAFANVDSSSRLRLMQFASVPTAATRARLAAAGYHPLVYIPVNALLVRADAHPQALATLPELRWLGSFPAAYKLPPGLDSALSGQMSSDLDLRLTLAAEETVRTAMEMTRVPGSEPLNFLQLSGPFRVTGRVAGRALDLAFDTHPGLAAPVRKRLEAIRERARKRGQ
jgi:hypothetical protein